MVERPDSFEEMYRAHYKALRHVAENITGDDDAAHDLVQDVFVRLWHRRTGLEEILNKKAYLLRAVINASISYLESNKYRANMAGLRIVSPSSTDAPVLEKELQSRIQSALKELPPKCKAIFVLSRFEGLKNREISEHLGLSVKTVENQMGIALKRMKQHLKPYLVKDQLVIILLLLLGWWM
jgi:RNA polymerase sigma-70 factor (family 1)